MYLVSGFTAIASTGVAVPISSTRQRACWLSITAVKSDGTNNAANIATGGSDITLHIGQPILPGDQFFFPPVSDLNYLHLELTYITGTAGDGVSWLAAIR